MSHAIPTQLHRGCFFLLYGGHGEPSADPGYAGFGGGFANRISIGRPFALDAIVVLPDHLHFIWTLPSGDSDFATRWRLIKTWFTKHCSDALRAVPNRARVNKREQALWQRRYWEHTLRDEEDFARHADYIHFNPVKHGYAASAAEWPYSSFHRSVEAGMYPVDWAAEGVDLSRVGDE